MSSNPLVYWLQIGTKRSFATAVAHYKRIVERGPWGTLLRWAHECYMEGQLGTALLLYSRAADLGYEVAQVRAAEDCTQDINKYFNLLAMLI
jgi:TPR repeat protein